MDALGSVLGKLCEIVLPIPEESFQGSPDSALAVCTLSSMDLLGRLSHSEAMRHVSIAGRLLSENRGIDEILRHLDHNRRITTLLVCGRDVWGHRAGHSLLRLHQNGVGHNGRIIGSDSPDPHITAPRRMVARFRDDIELVNMMGCTDLEGIVRRIRGMS